MECQLQFQIPLFITVNLDTGRRCDYLILTKTVQLFVLINKVFLKDNIRNKYYNYRICFFFERV